MEAARVILLEAGSSGEPDDEALARALRHTDPQAAFVAWRRFAPLVTRTVRRLMGPGGDAEDLSQEVFLLFFRKVPSLRNPASVRSFLIGICIRVVRHEVRRRWLRRWLRLTDRGALPDVVDPRTDPRTSPGADPGARQVVQRYYEILDRLGSEARSLYVTRHIEGLGLSEVASMHGLSMSTTQRKLARAAERVALLANRDPVLADYLREHLADRSSEPGGTP